MKDDELVERVRKALYVAKRVDGNDVQAEVAVRGVARMLANNLSQFNRMFAHLEPSSDTLAATQRMGQQIVELTSQRGELQIKVGELQRQLEHARTMIRDLQRPSVIPESTTKESKGPRIVFRTPQSPHRLVLECVRFGPLTATELVARTGIRAHTLGCRLSEMATGTHFGGALVERSRNEVGELVVELTPHGKSLLDGMNGNTYRSVANTPGWEAEEGDRDGSPD